MSGNTAISWTNKTWNPLGGCQRVTAGCDNCYAFALHDQRHALYKQHHGVYPKNDKPMPVQYAEPFTTIQLFPQRLHDPLHWKKPTRIFVNSMTDLFHSQVPEEYIRQVFEVMAQAHWHTFQVLTKRAGRLRHLGPKLPWPKNVWMGVSIENDPLTPRANALRVIPAAVKFISAEPLLGPLPSLELAGIDWLIVGGESGPHFRPMELDWVRALREKCRREGVAFFFKQEASRLPGKHRALDGQMWEEYPDIPYAPCAYYDDCKGSGHHECPVCKRWYCDACRTLWLPIDPMFWVETAMMCPSCHYERYGRTRA